MRRDLKIGMLIGVGVVICATVALSLWPGASAEDRLRRTMIEDLGHRAGNPPRPTEVKPGNLVIPERKPGETDESVIRPFAGDNNPKPAETAGKSGTGSTTEPPRPKPAETIHVVAQGETLTKISQQYYGTSTQWQKILQANSTVLKAPEKIKPGMKLVIPDAKAPEGRTDKSKTATSR